MNAELVKEGKFPQGGCELLLLGLRFIFMCVRPDPDMGNGKFAEKLSLQEWQSFNNAQVCSCS